MDDLGKLKSDVDKRRKNIDSELKKLEKGLSEKAITKEPVQKKPAIPRRPIEKNEPEVPKPKVTEEPKLSVKETPQPISRPSRPFFESIYKTRKLVIGSAFLLVSILLIVTLAYIFTRAVTKEEFVSRAQGCKSGTYLGQIDNSLVKYYTNNCEVTKEIAHVGDQEPEEIRILFEGKKMTCQYRKGQFNLDHLDYFMKDIDYCWGDLKDILLELRGYKLTRQRSV